jgi:hypothetical protein
MLIGGIIISRPNCWLYNDRPVGVPQILYGGETWVNGKRNIRRISAAEMRFLEPPKNVMGKHKLGNGIRTELDVRESVK